MSMLRMSLLSVVVHNGCSHGIPDRSAGGKPNHQYCQLFGYFTSKKNTTDGKQCGIFTLAKANPKSRGSKRIYMGTQCHAHMQLWGSQGNLHHFIEACGAASGIVRAIESPRLLGPFRDSYREYWPMVGLPEPTIIRNCQHRTREVVSTLCGYGPQPKSLSVEEYLLSRKRACTEAESTLEAAKKRRKKGARAARFDDTGIVEKKKVLEMGRHKSGSLKEEERTKRDHIIAMPKNISREALVRSKRTQQDSYKMNTTFRFHPMGEYSRAGEGERQDQDMDRSKYTGPLVEGTPGEYHLVRPGTVMGGEEAVDRLMQIPACTQGGKEIMDTSKPHGIHVRLVAKNHSSLVKNIVTCSRAEGKLIPMWIRSRGGAAEVAGANQMDSSREDVHRASPNLILSGNQAMGDAVSMAMCGLVQHKGVVNLFVAGMYCGSWTAEEVRYRHLDDEELWEEYDEFSRALKEVPEQTREALGLSSTIDATMEQHLQSMASAGVWLRLKPLDPDILSKWKGDSNTLVPWNVVDIREEDVVVPCVALSSSEEAQKVFGASKGKVLNGWGSMLRVSPLACIGESTRIEMGIATDGVEDEGAGDEDGRGSLEMAAMDRKAGGKMELSDVMSIFFHSQGVTTIKGCSPDVVTIEKNTTINPPRIFLSQLDNVARRNLKPLALRAVHPATLNHDPVPHFCAVATGCFDDERLKETNEHGRPTHRWGQEWVLSNWQEAWPIMFKCIVGCVTQTSVLLQLWDGDASHDDEVSALMPGPVDQEVEQFGLRIAEYQWESRFVHQLFRKTLPSSKIYLGFLNNLRSAGGEKLFKTAVQRPTRSEAISWLQGGLTDIGRVDLTEFQVQVLMRTIECCIHEPFGVVDYVPTGVGGDMGAKCLLRSFGKAQFPSDVNIGTKNRPAKMKADLTDKEKIPFWLVHEFNKRVKSILNGDNEEKKRQLKAELEVCFLEWRPGEECLYHTLGIRRRFNACDAEHLLCLVSGSHQFTLPSRNLGRSNALDCEKHFPVRFTSGKRLARDLPFMKHLCKVWKSVEKAYLSLLRDKGYELQHLADIFRIDSHVDSRVQ